MLRIEFQDWWEDNISQIWPACQFTSKQIEVFFRRLGQISKEILTNAVLDYAANEDPRRPTLTGIMAYVQKLTPPQETPGEPQRSMTPEEMAESWKEIARAGNQFAIAFCDKHGIVFREESDKPEEAGAGTEAASACE